MDGMRYSYAWQKAYEAVTALAGAGSLDERLRSAAWPISQFPADQVPAEVHTLALIARRAFTQYPGSHPHGAAAGLIPMLPDARKKELANKVVGLFEAVCRLAGAAEAGSPTPPPAENVTLRSDDKWEFLYWHTSTMSPRLEQDSYIRYAQHYLPHFPGEVLLEWLGRHGYDQMRRWAHLDLEALRFERVEWTSTQIAALKLMPGSEGYAKVGTASMGASALARNGDWLAQQVLATGTWPHPVVVFDNEKAGAGSEGRAPKGFVLVEGHRRVSLLLNTPSDKLVPTHAVWVGRLFAV